MKNNVKPTERQLRTMQHMKTAKTLQEAMLAGGYSAKSAENPKQNFMDREGTKTLVEEYKVHLINAGASPEILAEIEVAGLFEENGAIRLGYLKEVKRGLGIMQDKPDAPTGPQVNINSITFVNFKNESES